MQRLVFALMCVFGVLCVPTTSEAASRRKVAHLEELIRARLAKPEGTVSISIDFEDRIRVITIGTLPKSTQSVLTVEYDIYVRVHNVVEQDRLVPELRIAQAVYVDLDKDGTLDLYREEDVINQGTVRIDDTERALEQEHYDTIIEEAIQILSRGIYG